MNLRCSSAALEDYQYWKEYDRRTMRRIHSILKDIEHPHTARGTSIKLSGSLGSWYSRRIDRTHCMVYRICDETIEILQLRRR